MKIRIHKKTDGYLAVCEDGLCYYLSAWESIKWRAAQACSKFVAYWRAK
jgi:hypothetical protein